MSHPVALGHILPAATTSQELAKQEYRPPATIDKELESALEGKKIWHCSEEEIKQAMRYVYILVGLRGHNYPTGIEKQLLHAHIFKYYGGHTPEEIRLAFEMAITHRLELKPDEVVCFENFSIAYFSRIMDAYRKWARIEVKQIPSKEAERVLTPAEKLALNLDYAYYVLTIINKLPCKAESQILRDALAARKISR